MLSITAYLLHSSMMFLLAGSPAAAVQTATAIPDDLAAHVRVLGKQLKDDRAAALKSVNQLALRLLATEVTGENRLYAGWILLQARRTDAALQRFNAYLASSPGERELGLAGLIEAASWKEENFQLAKSACDQYLKDFAASTASDLLRPGVRLRLRVEESMARVAILSNADPLRHYQQALEALKNSEPGSLPIQDVFNLRWYYSDALAENDRIDEAIRFLIETRPLVQSDPKIALQLEDRILFKQTDKLSGQMKYAEARELLEKRLPEMTGDAIVHRRVSKLLDRIKLINAPAPEFVPGHWIGGEPLTLAGLRGKVVLLEFFTSG